MKTFILALAAFAVIPLAHADTPPAQPPATDPFAGAFFPPELIMMARERIGLAPEQLTALQASVEKVQSRSNELRTKLEQATQSLAAVVKQEHVDEKALHQQLDKVLDLERDVKHLHMGLAAAVKNLLTPPQQAQLREAAGHGMQQLGDEIRKRLSDKVERVKQGAEKWAAAGRDPSEILQAMEQKFRPLLDAGKMAEAEAQVDQVLQQLEKEGR